MMQRTTARTAAARVAPWLVMLALLLRIAVPVGWMPAEGGFGIVPCAGSGPLQLGQPKPMMHHHGGPRQQEEGTGQPCPFLPFAVALAAPPPPLDLLPPAALAVPAIVARALTFAVGRGLAAPPPPPTGPPALPRS